MHLSLKGLKDSLMQTPAAEAISEKAILATHVSILHQILFQRCVPEIFY